MKNIRRRRERGVAMLLALLSLLLLTAIAAGMVYMSSTEISVNSNFKNEESAYFEARAGVEEVRDRMLVSNPNSINSAANPILTNVFGANQNVMPSAAGGVLYVLQNGVPISNVLDFTSANPNPQYRDDELCHDFTIGSMTQQAANTRCGSVPSTTCGAGNWCQTTTSSAPYALNYKWVRVTLKADNSVYQWPVDGHNTTTTQVCWTGVSEVVRNGATCQVQTPVVANPVYMITALAVMPNGARRIVQQEVAQTPTTPPPGGMYSTGTGCNALQLGGGASTGSFNSSTEGTPTDPPSNQSNTFGNIGANGNVFVNGSSASVNGTIASDITSGSPPAITIGACPPANNGLTVSGTPTIGTPPPGQTCATDPTACYDPLTAPYTPPIPPMPNPMPPTTSYTPPSPWPPGAYGNVSITSDTTLTGGTAASPAVYTLNSLSISGGATLTVTGPVIINLAGAGVATVLTVVGNSKLNNSTAVPSNLVFNYGGTDAIDLHGKSDAFAVLNAPNSAIAMHGFNSWYGQIIGKTIDDTGGVNFYWDTSLNTQPPPNTPLYEISLRELTY